MTKNYRTKSCQPSCGLGEELVQAEVSVICATYNHEKYIKDALEGFIAQRTSFKFKVFVGDDCSSDGTPDIIRKYARLYPDIIVPVIRQKNIGAGKNWVDLLSRTDSKYIAFCDGDDYWTDPFKLQKQFDYMEHHPNLRACFHDVEISIETDDGTWFQSGDYCNTPDGRLLWPSGNKRFKKRDTYRIENFIPFGFVHTSSMFIKWDYSIGFPDWFYGHGMSDYPMWLLQINTGRFGYIDEVLSTHRRTSSGSYQFSSKTAFWRQSKIGWVNLDTHLIDYFKTTYHSRTILMALIYRQRDDLAKLLKGSLDCDDPSQTWKLLIQYRKAIRHRFGICISGSFSYSKFKRYIALLQTVAPLPPYKTNLAARAIRKFNLFRERRMLDLP